jgi:hypothetical protein
LVAIRKYSTSEIFTAASSHLPRMKAIANTSYSDTPARTLQYDGVVLGGATNMSILNCANACQSGGYTYAGTEYSGECCKYSFHLNCEKQLIFRQTAEVLS